MGLFSWFNTSKQRTDRLNHLIEVIKDVDTDPQKTLSLHIWCWPSEDGSKPSEACAAAWAGFDPLFQKQGFAISSGRENNIFYRNINEIDPNNMVGSAGVPCFENDYGFTAIRKFFKLNLNECFHIFYRGSYNKDFHETIEPFEVINHIHDVMNKKIT